MMYPNLRSIILISFASHVCAQTGYYLQVNDGTTYTVANTLTKGFPKSVTAVTISTTSSTTDTRFNAPITYGALTGSVYSTRGTWLQTQYYTTYGTNTINVGDTVTFFPGYPTLCPSNYFGYGTDCVYCPSAGFGYYRGDCTKSISYAVECISGYYLTGTETSGGYYTYNACAPSTVPVTPECPHGYTTLRTGCAAGGETLSDPFAYTGPVTTITTDGVTLTEAPGVLPSQYSGGGTEAAAQTTKATDTVSATSSGVTAYVNDGGESGSRMVMFVMGGVPVLVGCFLVLL
jgi:hypothetical protein